MAPACLAAIFEGDNGGATARGVSATEIRLAIPMPTGTSPARLAALRALVEHFNRRFEFYGRRLVPVVREGSARDAATARAFGATIAAEGVFAAATGYLEAWDADAVQASQSGILQEFARSSVVAVTQNAGIGFTDRTTFDALHPYVWSVYPSAESNQENLAALACTALVGRPAARAHDAAVRDKTRQFGVLALGIQTAPNTSRLVERLRDCGQEPVVAPLNSTNSTEMRAAFERLKAAGVTSLFCICEGPYGYYSARSSALGLGFGPEWLLLPSPLNFEEFLVQGNADRMSLIRLESGPRLLPVQSRPWFGPLLESGFALEATDASRQDGFYVSQALYGGLLLVASGIQAAGPILTPETFAAGLMSAQFPNPRAGQAPYYQPSAGFGPGDHAFHDDFAVAWWSDSAPGVDAWGDRARGSWCYLGAGARYRPGTYPADADSRLYNPNEPCR